MCVCGSGQWPSKSFWGWNNFVQKNYKYIFWQFCLSSNTFSKKIRKYVNSNFIQFTVCSFLIYIYTTVRHINSLNLLFRGTSAVTLHDDTTRSPEPTVSCLFAEPWIVDCGARELGCMASSPSRKEREREDETGVVQSSWNSWSRKIFTLWTIRTGPPRKSNRRRRARGVFDLCLGPIYPIIVYYCCTDLSSISSAFAFRFCVENSSTTVSCVLPPHPWIRLAAQLLYGDTLVGGINWAAFFRISV